MGGYIELDTYHQPMLHENAIALNCGRNALAYLIEARNIKKICIPSFLCNSVAAVCKKYDVMIRYYHISMNFKPIIPDRDPDEWLYLVNFYGQITREELKTVAEIQKNIIIDNAQDYFSAPLEGIDTLYTCRKYFGVPDGAFLYTDSQVERDFPRDESFERMRFLLGRFERSASEFYQEYTTNNGLFENEPIKSMSKLTINLLKGIHYSEIKERRTRNFSVLHRDLGCMNKLTLCVPEGAFMYPFYCDHGSDVRRQLQHRKIYIPTLWPAVLKLKEANESEVEMAKNILPLPCDQRYGEEDMLYMLEELKKCIS